MKKVILFDPAISSINLGDYIISSSAKRELKPIIDDAFCIDVSTHLPLSWYYMRLFLDADYRFVLGSNLLKSSFLGLKNQWAISLKTSPLIRNSVLVGAGWWQYNNNPNLYTRLLLREVLSKEFVNSVRDEYTKEVLKSIGIRSINTGCPTIWMLTEEHCSSIDPEKKDKVVFTVTDYNKDPDKDKAMIDILKRYYHDVYFWPQGYGDVKYVNEICDPRQFHILSPNNVSFDNLLDGDVDYVGTRLHGGIRSLQKKNRSIIISVDNRAREMKKDYNIPIIEREDVHCLCDWINKKQTIDIHIPENKIAFWKDQFKK